MRYGVQAVGGRVHDLQAFIGADPDMAVTVLQQCGDGVADETGVAEDTVLGEGGAVVAVEAAVGADPKDAGTVLEHRQDGVIAETVFDGEAGEGGSGGRCRGGEEAAEGDKEK